MVAPIKLRMAGVVRKDNTSKQNGENDGRRLLKLDRPRTMLQSSSQKMMFGQIVDMYDGSQDIIF